MSTLADSPRVLCVEAVADLPILWASLQRLEFISLADKHFPAPALWQGPLTPGEVLAVWLLYILSQGDHRLNHVEPWVARHQGTLSVLLGKTVTPRVAHDDRLADLLDRLSHTDTFHQLERELNQQTLRVYQLPNALIRLDTTTANSYAAVVDAEGLLQFGHSKDNPDLPQLKVATAILDPLGMPLTTSVVAGHTADDPLYIPAIAEVHAALGRGGRTYVGDCKMAALATRAFVAAGDDVYLCPLSEKQLSRDARQELLQPVWTGAQALTPLYRPGKTAADTPELVAEGFVVAVPLQATVDDKDVTWVEHRWVVRSAAYAATQQAALARRLRQAQEALQELPVRKQGKKQRDAVQLQAAAQEILLRERVTGLLQCDVTTVTTTTTKRPYGERPAREETTVSYTVTVTRQEEAIAAAERERGWQVYGTNGVGLALPEVVGAYRGQYRIEDNWSRLKGKPLGLTPLYLQEDQRIQGLVYLLSVALRLLTLLEWVVREQLRAQKVTVTNVYAGQPGRQTSRPTTELLLQVFKSLTFSVIAVGAEVYVLLSPLSDHQRYLLTLWNLAPDLYERLLPNFPKPPPNLGEP